MSPIEFHITNNRAPQGEQAVKKSEFTYNNANEVLVDLENMLREFSNLLDIAKNFDASQLTVSTGTLKMAQALVNSKPDPETNLAKLEMKISSFTVTVEEMEGGGIRLIPHEGHELPLIMEKCSLQDLKKKILDTPAIKNQLSTHDNIESDQHFNQTGSQVATSRKELTAEPEYFYFQGVNSAPPLESKQDIENENKTKPLRTRNAVKPKNSDDIRARIAKNLEEVVHTKQTDAADTSQDIEKENRTKLMRSRDVVRPSDEETRRARFGRNMEEVNVHDEQTDAAYIKVMEEIFSPKDNEPLPVPPRQDTSARVISYPLQPKQENAASITPPPVPVRTKKTGQENSGGAAAPPPPLETPVKRGMQGIKAEQGGEKSHYSELRVEVNKRQEKKIYDTPTQNSDRAAAPSQGIKADQGVGENNIYAVPIRTRKRAEEKIDQTPQKYDTSTQAEQQPEPIYATVNKVKPR